MEMIQWALLAVAFVAAVSIAGTGIVGACWMPTPVDELNRVLAEAKLASDEIFLDVGCGDGRTLIAAARIFGARGIGVEVDPLNVLIARIRVRNAGLSHRIRIIRAWATDSPFREADVIFMYLSHQLMDRLKSAILRDLKPGARMITYGFLVNGFPLSKTDRARKWFIYRMGVGRNIDRYS